MRVLIRGSVGALFWRETESVWLAGPGARPRGRSVLEAFKLLRGRAVRRVQASLRVHVSRGQQRCVRVMRAVAACGSLSLKLCTVRSAVRDEWHALASPCDAEIGPWYFLEMLV